MECWVAFSAVVSHQPGCVSDYSSVAATWLCGGGGGALLLLLYFHKRGCWHFAVHDKEDLREKKKLSTQK